MDDKWRVANDFVENWDDSSNDLEEVNWRDPVMECLKNDDIDGMKQKASPSLEWGLIKLAHETENEQTKFQVSQFLLSQAGHGTVQKVENHMIYDKLPMDQLISIFRGRINKLKELVPGFRTEYLLEGEVEKAELVEVR